MVIIQRQSSSEKLTTSCLAMCESGSPSPYLFHRQSTVLRESSSISIHSALENHWDSPVLPVQMRVQHKPTQLIYTGEKSRSISSGSQFWLYGAAMLVFLPWIPASILHVQYQSMQKEVDVFLSIRAKVVLDLRQAVEHYGRLDRQARNWEKENDESLQELRDNGVGYVSDTHDNDYQVLEMMEEVLLGQIDNLQTQIQRDNRQFVEEKYGNGPHLVEFKLSDPGGGIYGGHFVVELAPTALMPHAVHHFLQMVANNLWDDMALVQKANSNHVVEAATFNAKTTQRADGRFEKAQLTTLAFAEYHEEYLPMPYSLVFSGTPGGPEFFILSEDSIDVDEANEHFGIGSCFARVVVGQEAIINMLISTRDSDKHTGILAIDSVRLVQ